ERHAVAAHLEVPHPLELAKILRGLARRMALEGVLEDAAGVVAALLALGVDGLEQLFDLLRLQAGLRVDSLTSNFLSVAATTPSRATPWPQFGQQISAQPRDIGHDGRQPCASVKLNPQRPQVTGRTSASARSPGHPSGKRRAV